jgi:hypothetical protein
MEQRCSLPCSQEFFLFTFCVERWIQTDFVDESIRAGDANHYEFSKFEFEESTFK